MVPESSVATDFAISPSTPSETGPINDAPILLLVSPVDIDIRTRYYPFEITRAFALVDRARNQINQTLYEINHELFSSYICLFFKNISKCQVVMQVRHFYYSMPT